MLQMKQKIKYEVTEYKDVYDMEALNYFNQCNELYHSARDTYAEQFEPLNMLPGQPLNSWDWNSGRMPWEGGR